MRWLGGWLAIIAACCVLPATPALAAGAGKPPAIRSTSFSLGEAPGTVSVGAEVSRASEVIATVGTGGIRQRIELAPADPGRRTTLWSAEVLEGVQTCLPVSFVARNRAGNDVRSETTCAFGLVNPRAAVVLLPVHRPRLAM
jgi:hypothetical protein